MLLSHAVWSGYQTGVRPFLTIAPRERLRLLDPLAARAKASPIALVRDLDQILEAAASLGSALDRRFQYRQMSAELFAARVRELRSVREINRFYWHDTASTIKAYTLSSTWRILDLVGQDCVLLNCEGVLGPAILARSLIELTTVFTQTGGAVRQVVEEAAKAWNEKVVASENLERLLGKALHGTRTVPEGDFYRQTNVVTHIQKLSKVGGFEDVIKYYERLCEVAHPNALGNSRFWADGGMPQPDGAVLWSGNPRVANVAVHQIQDDTLWALAWSAANAPAGFRILDEQVRVIARAFP
jgi:hypothetical protein